MVSDTIQAVKEAERLAAESRSGTQAACDKMIEEARARAEAFIEKSRANAAAEAERRVSLCRESCAAMAADGEVSARLAAEDIRRRFSPRLEEGIECVVRALSI